MRESPGRPTAWFTRLSKRVAKVAGHSATTIAAVMIVILWCLGGPIFNYSDTWQLTINTGTTIVTFLMVFVIQSTQNRDSEAIQVKLDELIRVSHGAHNVLLDLEELDIETLDQIRSNYTRLARDARTTLEHGKSDTGSPVINTDRLK